MNHSQTQHFPEAYVTGAAYGNGHPVFENGDMAVFFPGINAGNLLYIQQVGTVAAAELPGG